MQGSGTASFDAAAERAQDFLAATLAQIRTDRASPSLIEDIRVDAYGSVQPVKALASVSVADARSLVIQAWDPQLGPAIGKAIDGSPLGVHPTVEGGTVRLTLPVLTTERRTLLARTINEKREDARIALRGARDEALRAVRAVKRSRELSEDQAAAAERTLERAVQDAMAAIDRQVEVKLKELGA